MKNHNIKNMELESNYMDDVHLLSDSWKLWYWKFDGLIDPRKNWLENLHGLCEFDSVEKFWR
jgi:hypothetical protein